MTGNIKLGFVPGLALVSGVAALLLAPISAQAACSNPYGEAGDLIFNSSHTVAQYCQGDDWIAMGGGGDSLWLQSGSDIYYDSGNVGIGTDTPGSALHVDGGVAIGSDLAACTAGKGGTIRYTSGGDPPWEFCDGDDWLPFKQPRCQDDDTGECYLDVTRSDDDPDFLAANIASGVNILGVTGTLEAGSYGCTAPLSCPNIGDVCDDGDAGNDPDPIFAGVMLYDSDSCEALYVTDDNQSTSSQWRTSLGGNDIDPDSEEDGKINDASLPDSAAYPAAKLCKDLTDGGFTDWYLPARDELHVLWKNMAAIDANAAGAFTAGRYWSSTEYDDDQYVRNQSFSDGSQFSNQETNSLGVRCVRRDIANPSCEAWVAAQRCDTGGSNHTSPTFFPGDQPACLAWCEVQFGLYGGGCCDFRTTGDGRCRFRTSTYSGNGSHEATMCAPPGGDAGAECPTSGLVAHWKLDEGSGTTANDSVGANHGTLTNGPVWTTEGYIDGGLSFDNSNDEVRISETGDLNLTGEMTFALWVKKNSLSGYDNLIIRGQGSSALQYSFNTWNDEVTFDFCTGSGGTSCNTAPDLRSRTTTSANLQTGVWYHLAGTYDDAANSIVLYVNGTVSPSSGNANTASIGTSSDITRLGRLVTGEAADGVMDDMRIYDRVLTPEEVLQLYNSGAGCE